MISPLADDDHAVRDAFVRWVSFQTAAPRDAESLIEHVEISHDYAGLLDTDVIGRRVVWKSVPAAARARVTAPSMAIDDVDPWSIEPTSLRQRSDHVAICDTCAGEKKVRCITCSGGKTSCSACGGQRKAYGYASNGAYRLLKCTACRGKGEVDCAHCRRGIAICSTCAGEGRVQRWMETESWRRSVSKTHPHHLALQFAWGESPTGADIARDAELLAEVDWPHRLTPDDIAGTPEEWLEALRPELTSEERVARQRLRIARISMYRVHYRLGSNEDHVTFNGLRLLDPDRTARTAFDRRAAVLRALRRVLITVAIVIALASLARDAFFRSILTFLSLLACGIALLAIHAAAADWTAARLHTRIRVIVAASSLVVAILFAIAALPRAAHVQQRIAAGNLDGAESELLALHNHASPLIWADLRLARIRQATEIDAARNALTQIPRTLPQYALATKAVDQLILSTARDQARKQRWSDAFGTLALLSDGARGRPESIAVAESVCMPSARERVDRADWAGAANAILAARRIGVAPAVLEPLDDAIRNAATNTAAKAQSAHDPRKRLQQRLAAEETFVSWEHATDLWGTPPLIALRTAMARDVASLERGERRHKKD
jgi:hypothetical protein